LKKNQTASDAPTNQEVGSSNLSGRVSIQTLTAPLTAQVLHVAFYA